MNGPPPAAAPARRDICWSSSRPPGRERAVQRRRHRSGSCAGRRARPSRSRRPRRTARLDLEIAVVAQRDRDPVGRVRARRSRLATNSRCWADRVIAGRRARRKCSAACRISEPQPQPTSSSRMPGSSSSLRQIRSSLARCASASDWSGVGEVRRRVRHRLVEDQLVELVGQVVVVRDHRPVAGARVQPADHAGLDRRRLRRPGRSRRAGPPRPARAAGRRRVSGQRLRSG